MTTNERLDLVFSTGEPTEFGIYLCRGSSGYWVGEWAEEAGGIGKGGWVGPDGHGWHPPEEWSFLEKGKK